MDMIEGRVGTQSDTKAIAMKGRSMMAPNPAQKAQSPEHLEPNAIKDPRQNGVK